MPKASFIGPVPIDVGVGRTGNVSLSQVSGSGYRAISKFNDEEDKRKRRSFGTVRQSVVAVVEQLARSKLPMKTAAELTRLTSKMQELMPE